MSRINVYEDNGYGHVHLAGWFDDDSADEYWASAGSILYRTAGGRWVRYSRDGYQFVNDETAQEWLIEHGPHFDEAVEKWFGAIEEERGPGRPEVGQPINVRLGDDLLAQVDAIAKADNASRAETVRTLIASAVAARAAASAW